MWFLATCRASLGALSPAVANLAATHAVSNEYYRHQEIYYVHTSMRISCECSAHSAHSEDDLSSYDVSCSQTLRKFAVERVHD